MAAPRHDTPKQIVRKLSEAEVRLRQGAEILTVCKELGVSEQTYYRWRHQYGGL